MSRHCHKNVSKPRTEYWKKKPDKQNKKINKYNKLIHGLFGWLKEMLSVHDTWLVQLGNAEKWNLLLSMLKRKTHKLQHTRLTLMSPAGLEQAASLRQVKKLQNTQVDYLLMYLCCRAKQHLNMRLFQELTKSPIKKPHLLWDKRTRSTNC